uniref:Uncharacterized protein n=1 Tax=Romanomermis culicivorax TaxID=13658 RepID=A0A915ISX3_ROMCU
GRGFRPLEIQWTWITLRKKIIIDLNEDTPVNFIEEELVREEPGANIEDRVIDDVAECQRLKTPPTSVGNAPININNKRKKTESSSKPMNNLLNRRHSTTKLTVTGNETSKCFKSQDSKSVGSTNGVDTVNHKPHVTCNAASVEE